MDGGNHKYGDGRWGNMTLEVLCSSMLEGRCLGLWNIWRPVADLNLIGKYYTSLLWI